MIDKIRDKLQLFIILKDNSLAFKFLFASAAQIHVLVEAKIIYF